MSIQIEPVGYVITERRDRDEDGWGQSEACIALTEAFQADALDGIDCFSHVEVLFVFHEITPDEVVVGMRRPRDNPDWPAVGIFAQRARMRPNRLGSTICRVVRREGTRLFVAELDAIDGTPVVDIKPVLAEFLPRGELVQPKWTHELMREYWQRPER